MTKILLLSDSHGLREELIEICERHEVTQRIHCGDSELCKSSPELNSYIMVGGNCDHDQQLPAEQIVSFGDLTCFITHGHLYRVKESLQTLSYRAQEVNARLVFYGHTHIASVQEINNQLFINPGSIYFPKGRLEKTYAIIDWNEALRKVLINFYSLEGNQLQDMTYEAMIEH